MLTLGIVMLVSTSASAFELTMGGSPYLGQIQLKYNNWDYGTLYNPGTSFDNGGSGSGSVDSWGVIQITEIQGRTSGGTWATVWSPSATEALEGWFYGLSDDKVNLDAKAQGTIYSIGGKIELYLSPAQDLSIVAGPQLPTPGNPAWVPTDNYNATNGSLFLSADFVPGIVWNDATTTYAQQINSITQPVSGHGDAYLSLTGGSYMSLFDSNAYLGGNADMLLASNFVGPGDYGWVANSFDPVQGYAIPEPTSMLLFGIGMLGFGVTRKRKKTA